MRAGLAVFAVCGLAGCAGWPASEVQQTHPDPVFGFARQLRGGDLVDDPKLVHYVQQVGNKLARASRDARSYEIAVIDSGGVEAWSMPGGKIALSRGLLREMRCESQLADVLAQQMAGSYGDIRKSQPMSMRTVVSREPDLQSSRSVERRDAMAFGVAERVVGDAIPAASANVGSFDATTEARAREDAATFLLIRAGHTWSVRDCPRYQRATARLHGETAVTSQAKAHELAGDSARAQGQLQAALAEYEQAAALNPQYYRPHLQAGLLYYRLKDSTRATTALDRSMELLPTAPGAYHLGLIARDANDVQLAVRYFQLAASSDSAIGRSAARALVQLDLEHNPERYVDVQPRVDSSGNVWMVVRNHAPLTVDSVVIEATVTRLGGRVVQGPVRLSTGGDALAPEGVAELPTSLGPLANPRAIRLVRAAVQTAEAAR